MTKGEHGVVVEFQKCLNRYKGKLCGAMWIHLGTADGRRHNGVRICGSCGKQMPPYVQVWVPYGYLSTWQEQPE